MLGAPLELRRVLFSRFWWWFATWEVANLH
jgi:hypothetical protein